METMHYWYLCRIHVFVYQLHSYPRKIHRSCHLGYKVPFSGWMALNLMARLILYPLTQMCYLTFNKSKYKIKNNNNNNFIKGINTWAVPLVRYSGPFLKWTRELKQMDQRTRKLMTMLKALYPRDDVDRLYVSKKEGGRRFASIEDSIAILIQ